MCSDQDFGVMTDFWMDDEPEDCVAANWNVGDAIKDIDVKRRRPYMPRSMTNVECNARPNYMLRC